MGAGHTLGEAAGAPSVTINIQQLPQHPHFLQASTATANLDAPGNTTLLGGSAPNDIYNGPANLSALIPSSVTSVGGSQPHNNMMPYLVLNFIIALQGIFPSRN